MLNGVHIRDLNGLEAATSQLPLIGFTVLWRLHGIRVSHSDLEQALLVTGFEKYLPDPPTEWREVRNHVVFAFNDPNNWAVENVDFTVGGADPQDFY